MQLPRCVHSYAPCKRGAFPGIGILRGTQRSELARVVFHRLRPLLQSLDRDLEHFFGDEEAQVARTIIKVTADASAKEVQKSVKQFNKPGPKSPKAEKMTLKDQALVWASRHTGHRVTCPACDSAAVVAGTPAGAPVRTVRDSSKSSTCCRPFRMCGLWTKDLGTVAADRSGSRRPVAVSSMYDPPRNRQ